MSHVPTQDGAPAQAPEAAQPMRRFRSGEREVTLLGTAHVSAASARTVTELLDSGEFDAVAVELCPSRLNSLTNPDALARMDLFQVLREGKAPLVMASLALGAYQQRLAEQFGIEPGAEMRAAVEHARRHGLPVVLIDRDIGITMRRVYRGVRWWRRLELFAGLLSSVVSREKVSEAEIERLKEGDVLESTFSQFAEQAAELYAPLIDERDRYMAARLQRSLAAGDGRHLLAVVGAGHLRGIAAYLDEPPADPAAELARLEQVPPGSRWLRYLPWAVVAIILAGFALGFARSPSLGVELVGEWVVINGGLAALGALLAGAHPLTIAVAFLAAPLTSLNPMIGAGMVTAGAELMLRRPKVSDFSALRTAATTFRGWWKNRVTRILLVFALSTLGSAIGTYLAGFRIFGRLFGG